MKGPESTKPEAKDAAAPPAAGPAQDVPSTQRPAEEEPDREKPSKGEEGRRVLSGISLVGNLSFGLAACVFVGFFLGRWLDGLLGTSPVLLILCTLLGVAASYKMLFDAAKKS